MLSERAFVNVRLALVAGAQQWGLHHGQVALDDATPVKERTWRYDTACFLECRLPGPKVAALMPASSASTYRLRGQGE
jgi:hypothetical protein